MKTGIEVDGGIGRVCVRSWEACLRICLLADVCSVLTSYIDLTLVARLLHSNFVFRFLGKSFTRKGRRSREPLPEELRWVVVVRI